MSSRLHAWTWRHNRGHCDGTLFRLTRTHAKVDDADRIITSRWNLNRGSKRCHLAGFLKSFPASYVNVFKWLSLSILTIRNAQWCLVTIVRRLHCAFELLAWSVRCFNHILRVVRVSVLLPVYVKRCTVPSYQTKKTPVWSNSLGGSLGASTIGSPFRSMVLCWSNSSGGSLGAHFEIHHFTWWT